jgi:hypothetical protein
MADPILDEDGIRYLLKAAVSPDNVSELQAGAVQAMIDLYDRKVTREDFVEMLAPAIALYGSVAKLWILSSIESVFDGGDLTKERFNTARIALSDLVRKQAETVIDHVKRLQECPTSQDKVH